MLKTHRNTSGSSYYSSSNYCLARALAIVLLLSGCVSVNAKNNPAKPHHTPDGFKNIYSADVNKSQGDFFRWQYQRLKDGLPKSAQITTPTVPPDVAFIQGNGEPASSSAYSAVMQPASTWIGHVTMLVQANGLNVLTDPIFSECAAPVQSFDPKSAQTPGLSLEQLPTINAVVISRNHYDHLDKSLILALANRVNPKHLTTLFLVPFGVKALFDDLGIKNVKEPDWWDNVNLKGVDFNLTPVQHWSGRGLGDRSKTWWGSGAFLGAQTRWYFSGDTGYSQDFADVQKRFADRQTLVMEGGFGIALVAVGACEPRWLMKEQHINPAEAVQVHQDLKANRSVGVHRGTFNLTDEPLDQPQKDFALALRERGLARDTFTVMAVSQTHTLPTRPTP